MGPSAQKGRDIGRSNIQVENFVPENSRLLSETFFEIWQNSHLYNLNNFPPKISPKNVNYPTSPHPPAGDHGPPAGEAPQHGAPRAGLRGRRRRPGTPTGQRGFCLTQDKIGNLQIGNSIPRERPSKFDWVP